MVKLTFEEALSDSATLSKRHLLLGNGFSIACKPGVFVYAKLFEQADFSRLSSSAKAAFEALGTQDFERVIKALRDAKSLVSLYKGVAPEVAEVMQRDADGLKEVLVQTIAASHPGWPGEVNEAEYAACRAFLANFSKIYTLNYDLLLYWTQMHVEQGDNPLSDDGFRKPEDDFDASYVKWESGQSHHQNTWFLHGALHIFDTGIEIQKYTWINTQIRLIDQIRYALENDYYPLFVAEGTSNEKLERIRHSDYLAKAYRSFSEIGGALFIFGHYTYCKSRADLLKWGMFYEQVKDLALEPFKRLTGVKPETFGVMVKALQTAVTKKRKSGRPSKLRVEDQLLMTLMYLRTCIKTQPNAWT